MVAAISAQKIKNVEKILQHCSLQNYPARKTILYAGDPCDSLYFILKGSVSIMITDSAGKEMVISYLNEGDVFGELGLFNGKKTGTRSAWVRARTNCDVAEITYAKYMELAKQDPRYIYLLGCQMADRLRKTTRKVGDLAFLDVTGRIAGTLLDLCKQPDAMSHPQGMQIKITRQELGRIVGCSREMVGRVLKELEERDLILVRGKTIVVFGAR